MSNVAFPKLSEAEQLFHDIAWRPLIRAGEQALQAAVPWLRFPILSGIAVGLIDLLSEELFRRLVLFVDVSAIRFVDQHQQDVYDSASVMLKIVAKRHGHGSAEYEAERKRCEEEFARFLRYGAA